MQKITHKYTETFCEKYWIHTVLNFAFLLNWAQSHKHNTCIIPVCSLHCKKHYEVAKDNEKH